ncbi:hypothetical protein A4A49_56589, partial [Nicotiana attenuata]
MEIGRETDGLYILREAIKPVAAAAMIKGNYNMAFKLFLVSRDVSFRETVFPFKERNYGDNEDGDSFLLDRTPTESMTSATPEARPQTTNSDNGQDNVSNTSSEGTHLENTADVEENLANSEANINPNSTDNISDSSMPAEMSQQQIVTIEQDAGEQTIDQNTGEQLEELAAGNQYDNQESNK